MTKPSVWDFIKPGDGSREDMLTQAVALTAAGFGVVIYVKPSERDAVAELAIAAGFSTGRVFAADVVPRPEGDEIAFVDSAGRVFPDHVGWVIQKREYMGCRIRSDVMPEHYVKIEWATPALNSGVLRIEVDTKK